MFQSFQELDKQLQDLGKSLNIYVLLSFANKDVGLNDALYLKSNHLFIHLGQISNQT